MSSYEEEHPGHFADRGQHQPDLFEKFVAWYQACQEDGALSRREKALIGLAVAHAVQCPYCIDAYAQASLEAGSNMEQMTEAIHRAPAQAVAARWYESSREPEVNGKRKFPTHLRYAPIQRRKGGRKSGWRWRLPSSSIGGLVKCFASEPHIIRKRY